VIVSALQFEVTAKHDFGFWIADFGFDENRIPQSLIENPQWK
jgi:hypothetical protein